METKHVSKKLLLFMIVLVLVQVGLPAALRAQGFKLQAISPRQEGTVQTALAEPLTVRVVDNSGKPIRGVPVHFHLEKSDGKAFLSPEEIISDEDGYAQSKLVLGKEMGVYRVRAYLSHPAGGYCETYLEAIAVDWKKVIFLTIGGLGLFLFGITMMSDALRKVAGKNMKKILLLLTKGRIKSVLTGAGITALIQSSSAMTVILIGLVNAGVMTFGQSIGMVMGANIGTTFTGQLIAFKIKALAYPAIGIGFLLMMIGRRKSTQSWGHVILGFGLLFLGLNTMSDVVKPLRTAPTFVNAFVKLSQTPILSVFIGMLITVLLQSSSATVGLTITLASAGLIDIYGAVTLVLGDNIGTTVTAFLASLNSSTEGKRVARAHILFNLLGAIYFLALLHFFKEPFFRLLAFLSSDIARQVANSHTFFNVLNTLIFLPFVPWFEKLILRMIPDRESDTLLRIQPRLLEPHLLQTPDIAMEEVKKEIIVMADLAAQAMDKAMQALWNYDPRTFEVVHDMETTVDDFQLQITDYLTRIVKTEMEPEHLHQLPVFIHIVNDLEKVSDKAVNLIELAERVFEKKVSFSEVARQEIVDLHQMISQMKEMTLAAFQANDHLKARQALQLEQQINRAQERLSKANSKRLEKHACQVYSGLIYIDVVNNLEKIGDHLANIAIATIRDFTFVDENDNK